VAQETPDQSKSSSSRTKRVKRLLFSALLGVAVGLLCQSLPEPWQIPCRVSVKLFSLFFGAQ
jgi:hypothetical protein